MVDGDHVGLFDVLVAPHGPPPRAGAAPDRRASAPGAASTARASAYLQVVATNAAALPLYADLGFETVYSYAYRVP